MPEFLLREELYDLVWTEPASVLARRFRLSNARLADICRGARIPQPPRGFWAKLRAGKDVRRAPLPPRTPGMFEHVGIPSGLEWPDEPVPPVFEDPLAELEAHLTRQLGRISVPRTQVHVHPLVAELQADRDGGTDAPRLTPIEKRRLRLLSTVFVGLERLDAVPAIRARFGPPLSVVVGQTRVGFNLEVERRQRGAWLTLRIPPDGRAWTEQNAPLETQVRDIVVGLVVAGEELYRASADEYYKLLLDIQADERRRRERLRLEGENQARELLLADAQAHRQAVDIRTYIAAAEDARVTSGVVQQEMFPEWATWARAIADAADPVTSGRYRLSLEKWREHQP